MSGTPGRREVAHRVFAAEYDQASLEYSESDEERAPNYVVTPTGARVNRLFFVGVLTEVESVSDDVLRARIVDPTGAFVVYAGQYQPEAMAFLDSTEPPSFVAVTGKARTFSPEDSDRVFTSVRPESVNAVDADTRDRWTVEAAEQTLARGATFAGALRHDETGESLRAMLEDSGVDSSLAAGIPVALEHYGTTEHYLSGITDLAIEALRLVADETDQVDVRLPAPDAVGDGTVDFKRLAAAIPGAVADLEGGDARPDTTGGSETSASTSEPAAESTGDKTDTESTTTGTGSEPTTADTDSTSTTADIDPEPQSSEADSEPASAEADSSTSASVSTEAAPSERMPPTEATDGPGDFGTDDSDDIGDFDPNDSEDIGDFETSDSDDIGDFAPGEDVDGDESASDDLAAVDDIEIPDEVLDEEERARIEAEYGTEFSTGTEVDAPGEAGIEPESGIDPETGELLAETGDSATEQQDATLDDESPDPTASQSPDTDASGGEEPSEASDGEEPSEDPDDLDIDDILQETMSDLDDGDGADREVVIESLVENHGVSEADVDDAINDALMGGTCYEPADGKLKPI